MTRMQIARAQQVAAGYPNAQLFGVPMAEDEHQLYGGVWNGATGWDANMLT